MSFKSEGFRQVDKELLKWYTEQFAEYERTNGDIDLWDGMTVSMTMASMYLLKALNITKDKESITEYQTMLHVIQHNAAVRLLSKARKHD